MYIISIMNFKGDIKMISEKIKELRENKGISQYRLAELTGIYRSTINRYENGLIQKISFDNLLKICEALGVDIKNII